MRFSKIKDNDIANGVGITMSIWTQGCPHHCKGCFNPETWDYRGGKLFTPEHMTYILENINKSGIKRNLSVLGGEPLCTQNVIGVRDMCKKFKEEYPDKLVYLWTGYIIEEMTEAQKEALKHVDFLIDGKFEESKKDLTLKFSGSTNQRMIDLKRKEVLPQH